MSDNTMSFTNTNTYIYANDNPIGFVQTLDVEDEVEGGERYSYITLYRLLNDWEAPINEMRSGMFSFKIYNSDTGGGYLSTEAEVVSFKMHLEAKKELEPVGFFEQTIIIKAKSFFYVDDAKSATIKLIEEEDLKNLIGIIKENQNKNIAKVVLPETKPKKKKKGKK